MKKFINNLKTISWPSKKNVIKDTSYAILSTVILTLAIWGWTTCIDALINLFF